MSDFRKPRADNPIVNQAALFRKVKKGYKRPKGRRGKKPKGKKSGNFVSGQDPNFILRKEEEELRRAREDRQRQSQTQERLVQAQIEDIRDRRVDRADNREQQREQLRLQGEERRETQRYRADKLAQERFQLKQAAIGEQRRGQSEKDILGEVRKLHQTSERREGENRDIFQQFLATQNRRGDLTVESIRSQEETDLSPIRERIKTPDERRDRRARSVSIDEGVSETISFSDEIPDEEGYGAGHRTRRGSGGGGRDLPERFGEYASSPEVSRHLSGQRKQTNTVEPPSLVLQEERQHGGDDQPPTPRQAGKQQEIYRPTVGTLRQAIADAASKGLKVSIK